jgi:hypothetical protein
MKKKLLIVILLIATVIGLFAGCTQGTYYPRDGFDNNIANIEICDGFVNAIEVIERDGETHSILYMETFDDNRGRYQIEVVNIFNYFSNKKEWTMELERLDGYDREVYRIFSMK